VDHSGALKGTLGTRALSNGASIELDEHLGERPADARSGAPCLPECEADTEAGGCRARFNPSGGGDPAHQDRQWVPPDLRRRGSVHVRRRRVPRFAGRRRAQCADRLRGQHPLSRWLLASRGRRRGVLLRRRQFLRLTGMRTLAHPRTRGPRTTATGYTTRSRRAVRRHGATRPSEGSEPAGGGSLTNRPSPSIHS
jgi:hypothetical protein